MDDDVDDDDCMAKVLFISLAIAELVGSIIACEEEPPSVDMYVSVPFNTLLINVSSSNRFFADSERLCDETTVLVRCESLLKSSSLPSKILFKLRCADRSGYVDGLPIESNEHEVNIQ